MKELTRLPTSKFHPSIRTKNKTLNGSEITVGGNIIMPMDMVSIATIKSITRNGSTIRKPISKPRRSSEIMKAGIKIRISGSADDTIRISRSLAIDSNNAKS